jgi:pimeloyl-ACP methyl ester carboxylesterase
MLLPLLYLCVQIKVIGGCDHCMIAEKPEAVDNALAEFLDTIKNMLPVYFSSHSF